MAMSLIRQFVHDSSESRNSVREVLQILFAAELLHPSRTLWIISPWIRDVPVLDNRTGGFAYLCPDFPLTEVRLSYVLRELIGRGTAVVIATRPDQGNRQIFESLGGANASTHLIFEERSELHAKGIVGDRFALTGSMNLTYNGIERLTEMVAIQSAASLVEPIRLTFQAEYGGHL
jgi:phosphatidylserine/phosphatidylglycerophosphate/cardiolipin synthase-like enzyme